MVKTKKQRVVLKNSGNLIRDSYKVVKIYNRLEPKVGEYLSTEQVQQLIEEPGVEVEING